tara:strand:+ start:240 stop:875 length:636 start_codon:yes stop_codon:yes gene_type:complete
MATSTTELTFARRSDPYCKIIVEKSDDTKTFSNLSPLIKKEVGKSRTVFSNLDPVWNMEPVTVSKPPPPPEITKLDEANSALNNKTEVYKKELDSANKHEKARYKTLRNEGKSMSQAHKIAAAEKADLQKNYKDSHGSALEKADKDDPFKFNLLVKVFDYDAIGDDDFLGEVKVSERTNERAEMATDMMATSSTTKLTHSMRLAPSSLGAD